MSPHQVCCGGRPISTVGNLGSTNPGFTMRTGLAERIVHTFRYFRFRTMLFSSLGFPAKSGLVLEVSCSQPLRPWDGIYQTPMRRTHSIVFSYSKPLGRPTGGS